MKLQRNDVIKKLPTLLFLIGIALETFYVLWDRSSWMIPSEGILFRISFLFFVLKIASTKYTKREWGWILLFGVIGLISYKISSRNEMLRIVALVAAAKDVNVKRVLRYIYAITGAGCVLIVLLSVLGIKGDLVLRQEYRKGVIETRYILGMGHPNAVHCMVFVLTVLTLYLFWNRLKWYHLILLLGANVGMFLLTDSKMGLMTTTIAIVESALLLYMKKLRDKKLFYVLTALSFVGMVLFCIAVAYYGKLFDERGYWEEPHFARIDGFDQKYFTGRMRSAYNYDDSNIKYFFAFSAPALDRSFDMGFYKLYLNYGYIPGTIYILINLALVLRAYREKDYALLMMVSSFGFYTLMEAHFITDYIGRNYLFLLVMSELSPLLRADEGSPLLFWQLPKSFLKAKEAV